MSQRTPHGGDDDSFEHGPRIGRGLADDPQDLGRRGLAFERLLQRLGERVLPLLRLHEAAFALGERRQQGLAGRRFSGAGEGFGVGCQRTAPRVGWASGEISTQERGKVSIASTCRDGKRLAPA